MITASAPPMLIRPWRMQWRCGRVKSAVVSNRGQSIENCQVCGCSNGLVEHAGKSSAIITYIAFASPGMAPLSLESFAFLGRAWHWLARRHRNILQALRSFQR
jgi:hypothetical protein